MIKMLGVLFAVAFLFGCASDQATQIGRDSLVLYPLPQVVVKEVLPKDAIKIHNLNWETSDHFKSIAAQTGPVKLYFDLGICYQMGMVDGFSNRKLTQTERANTYPIFKFYSEKDKNGFVDINVAYEGGYNNALNLLRPSLP